jgi:ribulose-phosphate 3-epimerase
LSIRLAPSILSADFAALGDAVASTARGGADMVHVDVMDGHFVPNISIGLPVVRALRRVTELPLDVHLMISEPDRYLDSFAEAGASTLIVHVEVLPHLHRTLSAIRQLGLKAGVALNPSTPLSAIEEVLDYVDQLLVMTVNPGFGGQAFIPHSLDKIRRARAMLEAAGRSVPIQVDGGVDRTTIGPVVLAGASIIVAGSAVFGTADAEAATRELKALATAATTASIRA